MLHPRRGLYLLAFLICAFARDDMLAEAKFQKDAECADDSKCFSDCATDGCSFQIYFSQVGVAGEYTIKTTTDDVNADFYSAVGFSSDKSMGGDSVTGCIYENGAARVFNAKNTFKRTPTTLSSEGVTLKNSSNQANVYTCTFERVIAEGLSGDRFDLNDAWFLLFARGNLENNELQFHTKRQASQVTYSLTGGATLPPPEETTQGGSVPKPSGCGVTKGCISDSNFVISWEQDGDNVLYTISTVTSPEQFYAAIGFSSDQKMGDDSVMGCFRRSNGDVVAFTASNTGKSEPTQFTDNEVALQAEDFTDNVFSCTIQRPKVESVDGKRVDVTKSWYILFATGQAVLETDGTTSMQFHSTKKSSPGAYSSSDTPDVGAADDDKLFVKVHGSLMVFAWIFLASIGLVVARYYKPVWTEDLCSQKVWFQVHRMCMVLVFCATVAGFVLIFLEVEGWSELVEKHAYLEVHPILGVVVTALTVLNPIMAIFRPHPGTSKRPIFNWAHWFVGTAAHIVGVITIFFGVQLRSAKVPDYMVYILAGYVAWQVLLELVLEVTQCCGKEKSRMDLYNVDDLQAQNVDKSKESEKTLSFKRVLLFIHIFVLTSVSAVLIAFIFIGEDDLD